MNPRRRFFVHTAVALALLAGATSQARAQGPAPANFDHTHSAWTTLLKKHVRWLPDGKQSRVNYKAFAADRGPLKAYLESLSGVTQASFDAWSRPQQMAFLINAYNAFTIELILTRYPALQSIKELGSFVQSAWKKKFFTLLGQERHLDWIEHEQLRPRYREPRLHTAVNCASVGCPALRDEAFTATKLEQQLEDGMRRFMADRTRNRVVGERLEVSSIFKWFREDFEGGHGGFDELADVFAKYAAQMSELANEQTALRAKKLTVRFLDYDWSLNDFDR